MHPMKRPFDNLSRPKFSKLYRLPFSRYSSFKFWSRDYHVIMTSQKFFIWLSKCPFSQPFIWGAAIGRTCFGSRDIWLLNFDHVTTWSRDFFKKIQIAHATPHPRGNWLWGIFFVHSLNPGRIVPPKNYHVYSRIYVYIVPHTTWDSGSEIFHENNCCSFLDGPIIFTRWHNLKWIFG